MTTTSTAAAPTTSLGPKAMFPFVMRTRPIPSLNPVTPRKDSPLFAVGAKNVPSDTPLVLKYWIEVVFAKSTSVKTDPNPLTVAGFVLPGTKKLTSTILLPTALKSR